jgi:hypothetical protein
MAEYVLTQVDGDEVVIQRTIFESIPTFDEFSEVAYYVDRADLKKCYKDLVDCEGEWIPCDAADEDGDRRYYLDEGVYFLLKQMV